MSAYTNVCFYECPLIWMSAYMNVCLYKYLLIQLSAYMNVCLYDCPLIRMSAYMIVALYECLLIRLSAHCVKHNLFQSTQFNHTTIGSYREEEVEPEEEILDAFHWSLHGDVGEFLEGPVVGSTLNKGSMLTEAWTHWSRRCKTLIHLGAGVIKLFWLRNCSKLER